MYSKLLVSTTLVLFSTLAAGAQNTESRATSVPIYRVTVIDRTISAVDYQYRNGPTLVDFRGTVLLPEGKGQATVESKAGRTEIDARFERLAPPTRFGREYLTYVLWAITPEGHAKNLGEVLAGHSDKAKLRVTTDLQAFGLIVTAEPYSAARLPSNVVVLENQIRPDTSGRTEPIQAKYELLPRGHYTYTVPVDITAVEGNGPRLSMDEYQQVVEIYEAQNAVQIAQSAGADKYAPDTLRKAEDMLREAQQAQARRAGMTTVVTDARLAAQTAEDARILAIQRKQDDDLAQAREQAARAQALKDQAEAAAQTARSEADASRALLERERADRAAEEAQLQTAPATAPAQPPAPVIVETRPADNSQKTQLRMQLLRQLNAVLPARDTPRGLLITIADSEFRGAVVNPSIDTKLARIAAILNAYPGLDAEVDGHGRFSGERASAIGDLLVRGGAPLSAVSARDMGDSRPLVSNASNSGREQNRRVEIVISGAPIGNLPYWTKSYSLVPSH